jgi:hypothetical protein
MKDRFVDSFVKKINTYTHVKNTYTIRTNDDQNIVND